MLSRRDGSAAWVGGSAAKTPGLAGAIRGVPAAEELPRVATASSDGVRTGPVRPSRRVMSALNIRPLRSRSASLASLRPIALCPSTEHKLLPLGRSGEFFKSPIPVGDHVDNPFTWDSLSYARFESHRDSSDATALQIRPSELHSQFFIERQYRHRKCGEHDARFSHFLEDGSRRRIKSWLVSPIDGLSTPTTEEPSN